MKQTDSSRNHSPIINYRSPRSLYRLVRVISVLVTLSLVLAACSSKSGSKSGSGDGLLEGDLDAKREGRFGDGSIPSAEGEGLFRDVFFDYDSSSLSSEARQDIEANATILKDRDNLHVSLEGHCDERGTEEYNLQLGQARARAVRDYLVSLGIAPNRLDTISYGENIPLDPSHSEEAWARNRRTHFSATTR
jgi:peptidoglycan-associated lipoprotein